jgi:hypothetical protein
MHRDSIAIYNNRKNDMITPDELLDRFRLSILHCVSYDIVGDLMFGAFFEHWDYLSEKLLSAVDDSLLNQMVDKTTFILALGIMRNGFHCCSGSGSSESEIKLHVIIAEFVLNFYEKHKSECNPVSEIFFNS